MRKPGKKLDEVSPQRLEKFFRDQYEVDCGHYTRILSNWTAALKEGNLFVGNYDDVGSRPRELLMELFRFLSVGARPEYIPRQAGERINATARMEIPPKFLDTLRNIYGEELDRLRDSGFAV